MWLPQANIMLPTKVINSVVIIFDYIVSSLYLKVLTLRSRPTSPWLYLRTKYHTYIKFKTYLTLSVPQNSQNSEEKKLDCSQFCKPNANKRSFSLDSWSASGLSVQHTWYLLLKTGGSGPQRSSPNQSRSKLKTMWDSETKKLNAQRKQKHWTVIVVRQQRTLLPIGQSIR